MILVALLLSACNEDKFLKETPKDFMSGSNAYVTTSDFDKAVNELYYLNRCELYCNGSFMDYYGGCDELACGASGCSQPGLRNIYGSSYGISGTHWDFLYKLIAQSNTLMGRVKISSLSGSNDTLYIAKA